MYTSIQQEKAGSPLTREQVLEVANGVRGTDLVQVDVKAARVRLGGDSDNPSLELRPGRGRKVVTLEGKAPVWAMLNWAGVPSSFGGGKLTMPTLERLGNEMLVARGDFNMAVPTEDQDSWLPDFSPLKENAKALAPHRVLAAIEKGGKSGSVAYNRIDVLSPTEVKIEVYSMDKMVDVGHGAGHTFGNDIVAGGAAITFSPQGMTYPAVAAFALRQLCTNGLMTRDVVRSFRFGEGGGANGAYDFFRLAVKEATGAIEGMAEGWRKLQEDLIDPAERMGLVEGLIRELGLEGDAADALRAQAMTMPPNSGWDAMNLATWATSHIPMDNNVRHAAQKRVARAQKEGGFHALFCASCGSTSTRRGRRANAIVAEAHVVE